MDSENVCEVKTMFVNFKNGKKKIQKRTRRKPVDRREKNGSVKVHLAALST